MTKWWSVIPTSELIRSLFNFVVDRPMVRIPVCSQLPATYRLSIAYLAKLPCAVRAGYSSGNHKPCLKGTREGVIRDIEAWEADEMNESVYWLKGVAGCGKSTIAQTFAECSAAKGKLGASFFCSRDYPDRRNLNLIFLMLARDLTYIRKKPLEYIDLPSQCSAGSCVVCGPDYSAS